MHNMFWATIWYKYHALSQHNCEAAAKKLYLLETHILLQNMKLIANKISDSETEKMLHNFFLILKKKMFSEGLHNSYYAFLVSFRGCSSGLTYQCSIPAQTILQNKANMP